jgi:hypothetical protein
MFFSLRFPEKGISNMLFTFTVLDCKKNLRTREKIVLCRLFILSFMVSILSVEMISDKAVNERFLIEDLATG